MTIYTESRATAEFLVSEANGYRSRTTGTVTGPVGGLVAGTVLGKITATGKYVLVNPDATTGEEAAAAILFEAAVEGDDTRTLIIRDAEVQAAALTYNDTPSGPELTAIHAQLAALGIIIR